MGDYARSTPAETFTETRNEQHPCAVAALQGVRLALAQETEKNSRWAESRLKQLSGGDKICARYMRGNFFEFVPQFKILICGNHRPRLTSVDEAMRRRMHLVPWNVVIPTEERDPSLTEKLKAEWPAILGWAVEGVLHGRRDGLKPPQVITDATDEYLSYRRQDRSLDWGPMSSNCNFTAGSTSAFDDYKGWCEKNNEQPGSQRRFSQELLSRQGISKPNAERERVLLVSVLNRSFRESNQ